MLEAVTGTRVGAASMEELYAEHAAGAGRLAYFLVGDRSQAEDLVHDAFVRVLGRWGNLRDPQAFAAYLNRTIVNLSRKSYRRKAVETRWLRAQRPDEATIPEPDLGTVDEMWRLLHSLPHRQRVALVLRFYEDMSEHQAAETMGCSPSAVGSLVARALNTLRQTTPAPEVK